MKTILRAALAATVAIGAAGCAPVTEGGMTIGASGPQYEPGDPCLGVVPQLCANPGSVVNRTPGEGPTS